MYYLSILLIVVGLARGVIQYGLKGFIVTAIAYTVIIGMISVMVTLADTKRSRVNEIVRQAIMIFGPFSLLSLIIYGLSERTVGLNREESFEFWIAFIILLLFIAVPTFLYMLISKKKIEIFRQQVKALTDENLQLSERMNQILSHK